MTQSGGTLSGTGTLTVTGTASLGSPNGAPTLETGQGTTDLRVGGTLSSTSFYSLDGQRTLQNDGTLNWTNGAIYLGYNPFSSNIGGATIINSAGATFSDQVVSSIVNNTGTNAFNNAGTFTTSFANGTTTIGVTFNNTGAVDAQSGTLDFIGTVTNTGTFEAAGGNIKINGAVNDSRHRCDHRSLAGGIWCRLKRECDLRVRQHRNPPTR
jgi:fibronectin-binding autotransporter adhesin